MHFHGDPDDEYDATKWYLHEYESRPSQANALLSQKDEMSTNDNRYYTTVRIYNPRSKRLVATVTQDCLLRVGSQEQKTNLHAADAGGIVKLKSKL